MGIVELTKETFSISDLLKSKDSDLWVVNNTPRVDKGINTGHVVFTIKSEDEIISIMVPETWSPINLVDQADRATILKSQNFRKAVTSRTILPISSEKAIKALEDRECRAEHDSAMYSINHSGKRKDPNEFLRDDVNEEEVEDTSFDDVNRQVYEVISRDDITEDEQLRAITKQHRLGLIGQEEKDFIMSKSNYDKVKAYVTNKVE